MSQAGTVNRDAGNEWVRDALGIDPRNYPAVAASQPEPAGGAPGAASPGAPAPAKPAEQRYAGAQANPFDAPEAQLEIERLTLSRVQQLAVQQAQNARADFMTALAKVKSAKQAQIAAEDAEREKMVTLVIGIALMPAGPLIDAAATALAGKALQGQLTEVIVNNAAALEKRFGAAATNKAFDIVAGEAVSTLAAKFDPALAKKALQMGVDKLKGTAIKFAASSDKGKAVGSFLDAMQKSANDAMHNLTDVILTTKRFSEAVAYYNLFSMPLQSSFEATLTQQVEDMLSQINDVIAQHGQETTISTDGMSSTSGLDEIALIDFRGRKLLAHVVRIVITAPLVSAEPRYAFRKWVTPDMQKAALALVKENLTLDAFKGQTVPEPTREPGERVVMVDWHGKERIMLIGIADIHHIFSADEHGICTFKRWADGEDDERALRSRGAMQLGGIDKMRLHQIQKVPSG